MSTPVSVSSGASCSAVLKRTLEPSALAVLKFDPHSGPDVHCAEEARIGAPPDHAYTSLASSVSPPTRPSAVVKKTWAPSAEAAAKLAVRAEEEPAEASVVGPLGRSRT